MRKNELHPFSLVDFGNEIWDVRERIIESLKLLEKDFIQLNLLSKGLELIKKEITEIEVSSKKIQVELSRKIYSPYGYHKLNNDFRINQSNLGIYNMYQGWIEDTLNGENDDFLEKIKIPEELNNYLSNVTEINYITTVEFIHVINLSLKGKHEKAEQDGQFFVNVLVPIIKTTIFQFLPKIDDVKDLVENKDDIMAYCKQEYMDIVETVMKEMAEHYEKNNKHLCFAAGVRHKPLKDMDKYLKFQEENYENDETDFYDFAELSIKQYKKYISKDQRKLAKKWIKKRRNEAVKNPSKIKKQVKIISPQDKTKLHWQGELKHLINYFLSLRELNQLNATNCEIMGFIHLHFVDRFSKPYDLDQLKNYLGGDIEPVDEPIMKWLGGINEFCYIWVSLYNSHHQPKKYMTIPSKSKLIQILLSCFTKSDDSLMSKGTLNKKLNINVHNTKNIDDNLDVRQLMKIGS